LGATDPVEADGSAASQGRRVCCFHRTGNPKRKLRIGAWHTLEAARTAGMIGPSLDKAAAPLTEALIIKAITNGGATIMSESPVGKCTGWWRSRGTLSAATINNLAAFGYSSTHT
jgi:hypothetical protein